MKLVYTPDDEPYLGRELLFHFDQMISCCMELSSKIAPLTHNMSLSKNQEMACQVIPQSLSIALSIRELIRQGYLFGAHVLKRSFIERVMILMYLHCFPEKIQVWCNGWKYREAPSLAKMFESVNEHLNLGHNVKGFGLTASLNSLVHGKPDSAPWNLTLVEDNKYGYAPSKIIDNPKLCDELCADVLPWLAIIPSITVAYFPELELNE